jgi:hypothetical protein
VTKCSFLYLHVKVLELFIDLFELFEIVCRVIHSVVGFELLHVGSHGHNALQELPLPRVEVVDGNGVLP